MHIIGVCRFSYLGFGGFQVEHDSLADRAAYLYAPDRMALRFKLFDSICLPTLRAQTDPDFSFLIVIGEDMPRALVDRLRAAVQDVPQIAIEAHAPGQHRQVINRAIEMHRPHDGQPSVQFRLDDDDGVSIHFVERLRRAAQQARSLLETHRTVAIDFNKGFVIAPQEDGLAVAPVQEPYWSPGLALMKRASAKPTILSFGHRQIWKRMATLTLPDDDMIVRGLHANNDSRQKDGIRQFDLRPVTPEQSRRLKSAFNIDTDAIRRAFSTPQ